MKRYVLIGNDGIEYLDWIFAIDHFKDFKKSKAFYKPRGNFSARVVMTGENVPENVRNTFNIPFRVTQRGKLTFNCGKCYKPLNKLMFCLDCTANLCNECFKDKGCPDCDKS
jgi:hypothetical protein